ncbi:dipeptidase [Jeotgalicoccus halotolerans]|uniref:dipeptidase n=1 Tax=Jeotgalicoccus halotolerans TaxID=157227 RepID=UPI003516C48F
MNIIDTHCDALLKLQGDARAAHGYFQKNRTLNYLNSDELDTNMERRIEGQVKVQFYAIFISPGIPDNEKWQHALEQIDAFYEEVLTMDNMVHIKQLSDIKTLKNHEYGAVLTLEGSDAFGNDLMKLRTLFRLGVLSVGLVWNNGNLAADGVGETRGTGLSEFGLKVVEECNKHNVLIDVSHLNVHGFEDVIEHGKYVFASHSNAWSIHNHARNLHDEQIIKLIKKGGMINIVFCPPFIGEGKVTLEDLLRHVDKIIELGGEKHIGLGSDFDGITEFIEGLEDASEYGNLIEVLRSKYGEEFTERIASRNFVERFC